MTSCIFLFSYMDIYICNISTDTRPSSHSLMFVVNSFEGDKNKGVLSWYLYVIPTSLKTSIINGSLGLNFFSYS